MGSGQEITIVKCTEEPYKGKHGGTFTSIAFIGYQDHKYMLAQGALGYIYLIPFCRLNGNITLSPDMKYVLDKKRSGDDVLFFSHMGKPDAAFVMMKSSLFTRARQQ